jgi:3-methyladenine DNA glycosylase Mpg
VLVRALLAGSAEAPEPVVGPGRVGRHLGIDQRLEGVDATTSDRIWIEDRGTGVPAGAVRRGPRIGIDYSGVYWAARPWRFWIALDFAEPSRPE